MFNAEWTGCYPNLCSGKRRIYWDGVELLDLPEEIACEPKKTLSIGVTTEVVGDVYDYANSI